MSTSKYEYKVLELNQTDYMTQSIECLTYTFVGMKAADKLVQEPMVGHLDISYDVFYSFVESYMQAVVDQGYCTIALDGETVVGVMACDINAPVLDEYYEYKSYLSAMNVIKFVMNDVDKRFVDDYEKRHGESIRDGEVLHMGMLGVSATSDRHEIVNQLVHRVFEKASSEGLKLVFAEVTNPKSMKLLERQFGMTKYEDLDGQIIYHTYKDDKLLSGIPGEVADATYVITRSLDDYI
ncbi:MAG: hypothetical protein FWC91_06650 [Defluviitaleaceae bacterium]|nr:hypothetical protein [Defluviitaleaceae bacterium]